MILFDLLHFVASLCAKCSHCVAIEMHNSFVEDVVSTESVSTEALSVATLILGTLLCISIAYHNSYSSRWIGWLTYTIEFQHQHHVCRCSSHQCISNILTVSHESFIKLILQLLHQSAVLDFGVCIDGHAFVGIVGAHRVP